MKKVISVLLMTIIMFCSSISANALEAGNTKIISNGYTTYIIEPNGSVKAWGKNIYGEVGNGTTDNQLTPVDIGLSNIKEIVTNTEGNGFVFALDNSGQVYGWGYNGYGQLGVGTTQNVLVPTLITDLPEISKIRINNYTVYVITTDGDVYAVGKNNYGQVGNGTKVTQTTFTKINISGVRDIVCMEDVAYAITYDKRAYAWGKGSDCQIGCGEYLTAQTTPNEITAISGIEEIITNGTTTFAILDGGQELYSWGVNSFGEAGNYSEKSATPFRVNVISNLDEIIEEVVIKNKTSFALMDGGTLYGWGVNSSNELGDGGTFNSRTPKVIQNIPNVKQFIFNGYTGLVLGTDGCVYSWGKNLFGEAGTGNSYRKSYASKITVLGSDIEEIHDGYNSMYAVDSYDTAYGWGKNSDLQIATRGVSLCAPTVIQGIDNVQGIQKSGNLVLAFNEDNIIYTWGDNSYGQAGDGTLLDIATPFVVYDSVSKTIEGTGNVQSTVPVIGTINALEVSVTHPLNISYVINPNIEESFVCSNISIKNNSKVPVKLTIESFRSSEGSMFEDVMPDSMDWDTLSSADTRRYIALGIDYVDISQLINAQSVLPLYAAEIDNNYLGVLSSGSTGTLSLSCNHGLAFEGSYEAEHELIFIVSIY